MTPDQATSVNLALSHARMRENAQALATFGGMSTTSYMLWSSLPPTWTATAGAGVFQPDASSDITDVFTWMADANNAVLIMDVFPGATGASKFSDAVKYVFHTSSVSAFASAPSWPRRP